MKVFAILYAVIPSRPNGLYRVHEARQNKVIEEVTRRSKDWSAAAEALTWPQQT